MGQLFSIYITHGGNNLPITAMAYYINDLDIQRSGRGTLRGNFVCWADSMLSEKTDLMRRNGLKRRMTIWLWSNWTRIAARLHLTTLEVEGAEAFDEVHAGLYGVASASGF